MSHSNTQTPGTVDRRRFLKRGAAVVASAAAAPGVVAAGEPSADPGPISPVCAESLTSHPPPHRPSRPEYPAAPRRDSATRASLPTGQPWRTRRTRKAAVLPTRGAKRRYSNELRRPPGHCARRPCAHVWPLQCPFASRLPAPGSQWPSTILSLRIGGPMLRKIRIFLRNLAQPETGIIRAA